MSDVIEMSHKISMALCSSYFWIVISNNLGSVNLELADGTRFFCAFWLSGEIIPPSLFEFKCIDGATSNFNELIILR